MDNIQKMDLVGIELNSGNLHRTWLNHSIGTGDNRANRFGMRVFRDGQPVTLGGASVQGYFRNSQGTNIAISSGTISGNTAYVTLPQACYNYDGPFTLAIKLIGDGVTGTMRIVDGMVDNTNSGSAVAPTGTVPTYQEVLAVYDQMLAAKNGSVRFDIEQTLNANQKAQARANTESAREGNMAPEYDTMLMPIEVGTYAMHNGLLYRCTTRITNDASWTAGHWQLCTTMGELNDLKNFVNDLDAGNLYVDKSAQNPKTIEKALDDTSIALSNASLCVNAEFTEQTGIITTDGRVIGEGTNCHTSDIWLDKNDTLFVYSYNYSGFSIIAMHENGKYTSLSDATENGQKTVTYKAPRGMHVACSYQNNRPYSFMIIRNFKDEIEETNDRLNDYVDVHGIDWVFGSMTNGVPYETTTRILSDFIHVSKGTKISVDGMPSCLAIAEFDGSKTYIPGSQTSFASEYTVSDNAEYIRIIIRKSSANETISTSEMEAQYERCSIKLKLPKDAYFFSEEVTAEIISSLSTLEKQSMYIGVEAPTYTILEKIINASGNLVGSSPNSHTSDIHLNKGDIIIVNSYYYSGFAIIAEHSGNYYIPLISSVSNANVTVHYLAPKEMNVSCSLDTNRTTTIIVLRSNNQESFKISESLNNIIDQTSVTWEIGSFDSYGVDYASNNRVRSGFIPVTKGTTISVTGAPNSLVVYAANKLKQKVVHTGWINNSYTVGDDISFIRILIRVNSSNPDIAAGDISIQRDRCTVSLKLPRTRYYENDYYDDVPSYYQEMMNAKAALIRANMAEIGTKGDSFIFFTDFHIDSNTLNSPALIKYLINNCGIERVVFGGDAINLEATKANAYQKFETFIKLFRTQGVTFNTVVGNHEFNNPSENPESTVQLTNDEIYPFFVKTEELNPFATCNPADLAYYIDNDTQKIRYLYVPCGYNGDITQTASDYAVNAIENLQTGWGIVVFTHYALQSDRTMRPSFTSIAAALDALDGTNRIPICVITGHVHRDIDGTTEGGVLIIGTTCDSNIQEKGGLTRTAGTADEHAFDVFQINTDPGVRSIKVVRIGAGSNRSYIY